MEMILTRIGPVQDKRPPPTPFAVIASKARVVDSRTYEFFCLWTGDPFALQELITARVDWGPFEIHCERNDRSRSDHCRCKVRYNGVMREQEYLMRSFWGLMERFPPFE